MTKNCGIKFNITRFIIFIIGFIILWIFGDFAFSTFITHSGYVFSVAKDICMPLIFAIPTAAFTQLLHLDG